MDGKQVVSNMAQGVSQQAPQSRRDTQCEEQFDMLNQPVEGATARPGFELTKKLDTADNENAFFYDIIRDDDERYTVIIKNGVLRVVNFLTGTECTVTHVENVDAYLKPLTGGVLDADGWCATTGEDDTFIANKTIAPQMGTVRSVTRPFEALFWFRAGGYKVTYQISVKSGGTWYNYAYTTPDNSVPPNAEYVTTNNICSALYNAMVAGGIVGLGFTIERVGNIMRLSRAGTDFDIETVDGQNNIQLNGLKNKVGGLEDIPKNGFDGMSFQVAGVADEESDDWFVTFDSNAGSNDSTTQGAWVETVKPNTVINLAYNTMPLYLFNTAVNTFELSFGSWGDRLSGDGEESAKDPSFVGKLIEDLSYDQRRLNILTKGSTVWSRTNNAFVYFPDTARASLATAPIDANPRVTTGIAILHKLVQTNSFTYLWAEGVQLTAGKTANSVFSNASIDITPSSAFEWNHAIRPVPLGRSLLFTTALGEFSSFTDVEYQQGMPTSDEDISEHVPEYVPADLIEMVASYTAKKMVAVAASTPNRLYIYEYRLTSEGRVQSAWNCWRLPLNCTVLHVLFDKSQIIAYIKRPEGTFLVKLSVAPRRKDPGQKYLTRMDFRVDESDITLAYNATLNQTTLTLPYAADDEMDYTLRDGYNSLLVAVRLNSGEYKRGQELRPLTIAPGISTTQLVMPGNLTGVPLYAGFRISARRRESTLYRRSDQGYVYLQNLTVMRAILQFSTTGYTRYELHNSKTNQLRRMEEYEGRRLGDQNNLIDAAILGSGDFDCAVGELNEEAVVDWINDSFLPSSWGGLTWQYQAANR